MCLLFKTKKGPKQSALEDVKSSELMRDELWLDFLHSVSHVIEALPVPGERDLLGRVHTI